MSINKLFSILKGGSGSGNRGHSGIPGHRGGSVSKIKGILEVAISNYKFPEVFPIPENHKFWEGSEGKPDKPCKTEARACHNNALSYVKNNPGTELGVGRFYHLDKNGNLLGGGDHVWVMENGKVKDPTLGKTNLIYSGVILSNSEAKKIKNADQLANALSDFNDGNKSSNSLTKIMNSK